MFTPALPGDTTELLPSLRSSYSEISRSRSSICIRSASITAEFTSSRSAERRTDDDSFFNSASGSESCSLLCLYSFRCGSCFHLLPGYCPEVSSGPARRGTSKVKGSGSSITTEEKSGWAGFRR